VTTEKDACKLAALLQPTDSWWAVRLSTSVTVGEDRLKRLEWGVGETARGGVGQRFEVQSSKFEV
jgi:hypothetical protein